MKKIIFTLLTSVFVFTGLNAQTNVTDFRDRLMFGFKIGANYSNVYNTDGEAFVADPKFGLAAGLFVAIPLGKLIGVQPEILFSQKGFKATGILLSDNYGLTRTTNFIDVPLFIALKPNEFITLLAGPQYSYLTKQKDVVSNGNSSVQQEQEFKNDNVRKNILCFVGGLDITLKHSLIGARVGWDVQKNKGDGTSSTPQYKNVWYQLTVGYRFY